jgi:benzylsuccinate CoA-transferase BbsF subunit
MKKARSLPLEGIRVVDITIAWAGPGCAMMLSDMGAEVIKIENPALPDLYRRIEPFAEGKPGLNRAGSFAIFNRGKKDCLLDLKQPEGVEALKRLIEKSDILVENFSPRVMDGFGLGYSVLKEIKPNLIMISLSGYGATGPYSDSIAYGQMMEAYSGLDRIIGYAGDNSPKACGTIIADQVSSVFSAFAVLAALHHRDLTGEGQYIDLSEMEVLLACMPEAIMEFTMNGRVPLPQGNKDEVMAPHGCYRCQGEDKWVAIAVGSDSEWKDLCLVIGKPELATDERFLDGFCRLKNQDALDEIVAEWTSGQTCTNVMAQLQRVNIASGPAYSSEEVYRDPNLRTREFFIEIDHPEVGKRELPGPFAKLSDTPGAIRRHDPLLGEHTNWLLNELLASTESE